MKHLKTFEGLDPNLKVGDWVAIRTDARCHSDNSYAKNIPCMVLELMPSAIEGYGLRLDCGGKTIIWEFGDIDFYSKSKEDVEAYLQARKYNV